MPNILDRYAHDFRGIRMGEKELKKMLKAFVLELLPERASERWGNPLSHERGQALGYNQLRQEIIERLGGE